MISNGINIDHIDPRWRQGRDYQKICGFEKNPRNLREEDSIRNQSKSNRFLPWRWTREDLGVVPEEPGDLALFLDPDTGEWVLEEFMGPWWYEKTWITCGPYLGFQRSKEQKPNLRKQVFEKLLQDNPNHQKEAFAKLLESNPNHQSKAGSVGGRKIHEEKDDSGRSLRAKELGRMGCPKKKGLASKRNWGERWIDPEHPELGSHPACVLTRKQKRLGLPFGKNHRVRIE